MALKSFESQRAQRRRAGGTSSARPNLKELTPLPHAHHIEALAGEDDLLNDLPAIVTLTLQVIANFRLARFIFRIASLGAKHAGNESQSRGSLMQGSRFFVDTDSNYILNRKNCSATDAPTVIVRFVPTRTGVFVESLQRAGTCKFVVDCNV